MTYGDPRFGGAPMSEDWAIHWFEDNGCSNYALVLRCDTTAKANSDERRLLEVAHAHPTLFTSNVSARYPCRAFWFLLSNQRSLNCCPVIKSDPRA